MAEKQWGVARGDPGILAAPKQAGLGMYPSLEGKSSTPRNLEAFGPRASLLFGTCRYRVGYRARVLAQVLYGSHTTATRLEDQAKLAQVPLKSMWSHAATSTVQVRGQYETGTRTGWRRADALLQYSALNVTA